MKHELTHLDLFSGIGGFAIAAKNAGFRTIGFSEVEPDACKFLHAGWPQIPNLGDVRNPMSFAGLGHVTVLSGGFPCQPWSFSGRKLGTADHRHLWPAMLGVVEIVRPAWVIGENVPALESLGGADEVCADLEKLGYAVQPFNIPACAAGAPFIGDRLWFLAEATGDRQPGPREPFQSIHSETSGFEEADSLVDAFQRDAMPYVCRQHDGLPKRTASPLLKGVGNAIVPQVVEPFFHWIAQIEKGEIT